MHQHEAAGGLVDVHDAVCAGSVLIHQSAQFDGQPVAVGELLLRHLAGFLQLSRMPRKSRFNQLWHGRKSTHSASGHSCTKRLIVTALGRKTSVTRKMCSQSRVTSAGDSKVFLLSCAARGALRFQLVRSVLVDPFEHPRAQPPDLAQAPLHVPSPLCLQLVQHLLVPAALDGIGVDSAAFCRAVAGLVFNECCCWSGWRRGTRSAGVGNLLVCVQSGGGLSWSPPTGPPQADTMRELTVVENVFLQSMFRELLPRQWRPARPARHRARKVLKSLPDRLTRKIAC